MQLNEKAFVLGNKRSVIREIFEYGKKRSAEVGAENVFDFSLGNPSVNPPKQIADTVTSLLNTQNQTLLHGYTSAQGDVNTRKAIAEKIKREFGVGITENNIYVTCGAASSLTVSLKAVLNQGEECIVFAPYFTEYKVFVENAGGKLVVSLPDPNNFMPDVKDFESRINKNTRAVIINSPNNPSGVVYDDNTVKTITDILKRKSAEYGSIIYLIADEPYRELVYDNIKVPYIMNYYSNSIVCYSYSKSLSLPGERIGYIAINPQMTDANAVYLAVCGAGRSLGYVCAPSLFQQVIARCVDVKVDVNVYKENRDIIYNGLTELGFSCVKPNGAFYLLVKAPDNNAYSFYEQAKKYDILLVPCDDFGIEGYVRLAYCVDKNKIINSLPKFKELAKECFN